MQFRMFNFLWCIIFHKETRQLHKIICKWNQDDSSQQIENCLEVSDSASINNTNPELRTKHFKMLHNAHRNKETNCPNCIKCYMNYTCTLCIFGCTNRTNHCSCYTSTNINTHNNWISHRKCNHDCIWITQCCCCSSSRNSLQHTYRR